MSNKLNEEYFKNKKIYKENYKKRNTSLKQRILNIFITFVLISLIHFLQKQCSHSNTDVQPQLEQSK